MNMLLAQRTKQAFLNAPADKMVPAILIGIFLLSGLIGVALGASFPLSAWTGLVLAITPAWWFARKARISRERAAAISRSAAK